MNMAAVSILACIASGFISAVLVSTVVLLIEPQYATLEVFQGIQGWLTALYLPIWNAILKIDPKNWSSRHEPEIHGQADK